MSTQGGAIETPTVRSSRRSRAPAIRSTWLAELLSLHSFATLYVADLNSILRRGDNCGTLRRLRTAFPALRLWIDNGAHNSTALAAVLDGDLGVPVVGSEFQRDGSLIAAHRGSDRVILSLDFRNERFLGPRGVLESPDTWPNRVIVMNLARVGGEAGPDFGRLRAIRAIAGGHAVFAAGGLRDSRDLADCEALGCAGALVATALHDGRLDRIDLDGLTGLRPGKSPGHCGSLR